MKKTLLALALGALLIPAAALAQDDTKPSPDQMKSGATKAVSVVGKISDDGKAFVSDKDGKSWAIDNPDAVKGHEGHHVVLKAQVDPSSGNVHVMSLKMAKDAGAKGGMDNMKQ
jgi:hypothetical protein